MSDQKDKMIEDLKDEKSRIQGVFSTQVLSKVGTGATQKKTIQKTYWFVKELDDDTMEIQPLNINYVPSGPKKTIPKDDLLDKFSPEPEFYTYTVFPKMREINKTIARADRHRQKGESYSAEFEYGNALKVDEENIRANFGLGLTYLERGDKDKANNIFERLVKLDTAFEKEHKHLFNDFGINLRKQEMYEQALDYYSRALDLVKDDENLHYNIARVQYVFKHYKKCLEHLKEALKINPDFEEAKKFVLHLQKKNLIPKSPQTITKPSTDKQVSQKQA